MGQIRLVQDKAILVAITDTHDQGELTMKDIVDEGVLIRQDGLDSGPLWTEFLGGDGGQGYEDIIYRADTTKLTADTVNYTADYDK
jgi:hypothetical protein